MILTSMNLDRLPTTYQVWGLSCSRNQDSATISLSKLCTIGVPPRLTLLPITWLVLFLVKYHVASCSLKYFQSGVLSRQKSKKKKKKKKRELGGDARKKKRIMKEIEEHTPKLLRKEHNLLSEKTGKPSSHPSHSQPQETATTHIHIIPK